MFWNLFDLSVVINFIPFKEKCSKCRNSYIKDFCTFVASGHLGPLRLRMWEE